MASKLNGDSEAEIARQKRANGLFADLCKQAARLNESLVEMGKVASELRGNGLWRNITDGKGRRRFNEWVDVGRAALGASTGRLYALIDCYELTQGSNPIAARIVKKMGIKRAVEVAKLEPEDRTPEIIEAATTKPVMAVRNQVRMKLNESLPQQEQRPMLQLFAINLPEETAEQFEALLEVMVYMDGIRDGDNTLTMRQKAVTEILRAAEQYFAEELVEAMKLKAAKEGVQDSPAVFAEDDSYNSYDEHYADVAEPIEHQQGLLPGVRAR